MSSIKLLSDIKIPRVYYTPEVWNDIQHLVQSMTKEIGWWNTVEVTENGNYILTDTIIPEQWVSGGETDITKDTLAEAADELIEAGVDTSKLLAWGHSHVNMGTTPSHTDVTTAMSFREDVPFLIRGIYNKRNENRVDILDFARNILFEKVDNQVLLPAMPQARRNMLDDIMKDKVHERTYNYNNNYRNNYNRNQQQHQRQFGFGPNGNASPKTPAIPPAAGADWWEDINYGN